MNKQGSYVKEPQLPIYVTVESITALPLSMPDIREHMNLSNAVNARIRSQE